MKLTFLGTSADTSFPLPFCKCKTCKKCRKLKGKNLRRRSSLLINDDLIIDFGPDVVTASFDFNVDISKIKYLLVTHPHSDHFDPAHLSTRIPDYKNKDITPATLIASEKSVLKINEMLKSVGYVSDVNNVQDQKKLQLQVIHAVPYKKHKFEKYTIIPIPATHDESLDSLIYIISDNKSTVFYATDTNWFKDEVWEFFKNNKPKIDVLILDHTYGFNIKGDSHLNGNKFVKTIKKLKELQVIDKNTKIYATHISHEGNGTHEEMCKIGKIKGYLIAYDGLVIDIFR